MKRRLLAVMDQFPHLTHVGFEWMGVGRHPDSKEFKEARESLAESVREFHLCYDFLNRCEKVKTPNPGIGSSYALKHLVERFYDTYIPHGAFVAAVVHSRIPYRILANSTAIDVAISSRCPMVTMLREDP